MKKLLFVTAAMLALSACDMFSTKPTTVKATAAQDCKELGYTMDTPEYDRCLANMSEAAAAEKAKAKRTSSKTVTTKTVTTTTKTSR